jgi:hypothetical protein
MSIIAKPCRLDQHQSCRPIMLALSACFGVLTSCSVAKKSNKLLVFAKMSNAYLGVLDKPRVNIQNVVRVVRDMQQQVSKLLRHPDLPSKFMLLFAPELLVEPRFIFSDYVSCKRANQMVDYVNNASIIHAMWSEDGEYAKAFLRNRGYSVQSYSNYKQVVVFSAQIVEYLPQEFWVYNFSYKVKILVFMPFFKGLLDMFPWLESLTLHWFEDNIDLETTLHNAATLRTLMVHNNVPYQSLFSSKHITNLVVKATSLQSDVGMLTHLVSLSLYGDCLMTLPSEVSVLSNLRVLWIEEVKIVATSCLEALIGLEELGLVSLLGSPESMDFSKFVALRSLHLQGNSKLVGCVELASPNLERISFAHNNLLLVKPEPKLGGGWSGDLWTAF